MKRAEALSQIRNDFVPNHRVSYISALHHHLGDHLEELEQNVLRIFTEACTKVKQLQDEARKGKIQHIHITFFRHRIIHQDFRIRVYFYDHELYGDPLEYMVEYDASWAFNYLKQFSELLLNESKMYVGKIFKPDLDLITRQEVSLYMHYVANLLRHVMKTVVEQDAFLQMQKEVEVFIRAGEYKDFNELVYKYDSCDLNTDEVRQRLTPNDHDEYVHGNFRGLDLSDMYFKLVNLSYSYFTAAILNGSQLIGCPLIGADFRHTNLIHANFAHSLIHGADFSEANLTEAQLEEVNGSYIKPNREEFHIPPFVATRFRGANLTGTRFAHADLRGADFRGALFKETIFEECQLQGAHFDERDILQLELSQEQLNELSIYF
ncbi:pentapeptide repeat-containing protein [Paenibacillus sp. LS1]|uniref:pentapeptide repeat-containing protein n=1 Tax=Paenibacillus sp. LS1 TaxID=2992120 RepID=UPI0022308AB7|nr:pentapeptide repeat-containing protein [Paenibacillus sp. LS1]MCW3791438.1 pentapeptide repeat-containing protein [Paenibacillus sp. LS1]